jgi:dihydroxyacetone kinase
MKKIINDPADFVDEFIEGILAAHPEIKAASPDLRALVRADAPRPGKVGIVLGGGSGHLPVFLGYLGPGLCDGVAIGNVFSSPSAAQVYAATAAVSGGAGVLYLYGNYGGDIYNFDLAADMARAAGIPTATVLATDDVASAGPEHRTARRGVAGMVLTFKIAGAAAERGGDLAAVTAIARRANDRTATAGVGLSPTILPAAGQPTFTLGQGEMEIGIGIHGEPGTRRGDLERADAIADTLLDQILADLQLSAGARVAVLVNGLGATPLEELYLLYRRTSQVLGDRGVVVHRPLIGNFVTSLEMAGASISVLALDPELEQLLDAPARTPFFDHWSSFTVDREPGSGCGQRRRLTATALSPATPAGPHSPLSSLLAQLLPRMAAYADELRALDGALGDGDLGITVASGSQAALAAVEAHADGTDSQVLYEAGLAFAAANPSTFAALVGGGVMVAASQLGQEALSRATVPSFVRSVADHVAQRGGASPGDKTVLDPLLVTAEVLATVPDSEPAEGVLGQVAEAVQAISERLTAARSMRGRAGWLGDRSMGQRDPGMAAYAAFLQELGTVL